MKRIATTISLFLFLSVLYSEESIVETIKYKYDLVMATESEKQIKGFISDLENEHYIGIDKSICKLFEGSLFSKLADIEVLFWNKLYHVNTGVKMMEDGMNEILQDTSGFLSDNDLLTLHLVYGITSGYIPKTFQSKNICIQELETAINMNNFNKVDKKTMVETYTLLSEGYKAIGNNEKNIEYQEKAKQLDTELYIKYKEKN